MAIGKPERPKRHHIWAAHPHTNLSTKYPPPVGPHAPKRRVIWTYVALNDCAEKPREMWNAQVYLE